MPRISSARKSRTSKRSSRGFRAGSRGRPRFSAIGIASARYGTTFRTRSLSRTSPIPIGDGWTALRSLRRGTDVRRNEGEAPRGCGWVVKAPGRGGVGGSPGRPRGETSGCERGCGSRRQRGAELRRTIQVETPMVCRAAPDDAGRHADGVRGGNGRCRSRCRGGSGPRQTMPVETPRGFRAATDDAGRHAEGVQGCGGRCGLRRRGGAGLQRTMPVHTPKGYGAATDDAGRPAVGVRGS